MDNQPTVSSLAERLGGGSKREKLRDHHKEHRLSKADIGGPITSNVTESNKVEIVDSPESLVGPTMVIRGVLIHKDEKGYGLTVSGDNPVYVQSVKEDGAAHMAGVRQGDRIIKVNGTNVTDYNHIEVVKLIKAAQYVALTLLGPPLTTGETNVPSTTSPTANFIPRSQSKLVKDNSFYEEKVNTIKKMLEQEKAEVERIKEEYAKDPNKKLLEDLGVAQKLLLDLEKQLWKAESMKQNSSQDIPIQELQKGDQNVVEMDDSGSQSREEVPGIQQNNFDQKKTLHPELSIMKEGKMNNSETTDDSVSTTDTDNSQMLIGVNTSYGVDDGGGGEGGQQHNIMNFEEDELAEESDAFQDHGPFKDYDILRTKPAHMAIFINYVFRSHEPSYLLFVLMVENFRQLSSTKEMLKISDYICKNYLQPNAPLKVSIDEGIAKSIVDAVHSKNISEDGLRSVFDPAMQHALKAVRSQLQQFCNRREQGLSNCFGEDKISPGMDHTQEVKVVEEVLTPLIQDLANPAGNTDESESSKMTARMDALERFIVQLTGKRKSKLTSRIGSMLRPNRPVGPIIRPKTAGSVESIIDEQNKRMSLFGLRGGKNKKRVESSSTVIPVVQASHVQDSYPGEPGLVSQMVKQFQDGSDVSALPNVQEGNEGGLTVNNKKDKNLGRSGSFRGERRQRSATGKSNSDPDVNTVEMAMQLSGNSDSGSAEYQMTPSVSSSSMASTGTNSMSGSMAEDLISQLVSKYPELDVEPESQWSANTPRDVIKHLDKKECKRQEVINELFHTEKHHVRDLLILDLLFYKSMQSDGMLNSDELYLVFPNLQEILRMHRQLNSGFLKLKESDGHVVKDITDVLTQTFNGPKGNMFKEECAKFCGNQTAALEFIKERCKKDQKFNNFIQTQERHPICRRLRLKDFVPIEFQRLTKYPLLLENIIKNTKKKEEVNKLKEVQKQCKDILSYVNKAVKDAEDHQKIVEIQKNLDASSLQKVNHPIVLEYKNINLVERTLVHQGPLTWRITQSEKKKSVVLHCVLFEDIMVLLQKQDEKYVLKCHTSTALNSSKDEKSTVQPPILKLSKVIVRNVATDKRAFFVVSMSEFGPQIYELVASTSHEMQEWLKIVSTTAEAAKRNVPKDTPVSFTSVRRDAFMVAESSRSRGTRSHRPKSPAVEKKPEEIRENEEKGEGRDRLDGVLSEEVADDEGTLEKIKKKDQEISAALDFKHSLLAAYAGIESSQLETVLDMSLADNEADSKTLVLQSLVCVNKLTSMLNDLLLPDTVFLQPLPQPALQPTAKKPVDITPGALTSEEEPLTPTPTTVEDLKTPTPTDESNQADNSDITSDDKWAVSTQSPNIQDNQLLSAPTSQDDTYDSTTPDRRSNASLDLIVSDYETASEPASPSPSSAEEPQSSTENETEPTSMSDTDVDAQKAEETDSTTVNDRDPSTSQSDAGIGLSESRTDVESDNTLSVTENSASDLPLSPTPLVDLLDFGPAISPPDVAASLSPLTNSGTEGLMAKTNPLSVTKMLGYINNIETNLVQLVELVRSNEEEKQRLVEEKSQLLLQLSQMDSVKSSENNNAESRPESTDQDEDTPDGTLPSYADIVSDYMMMPTTPLTPTSPTEIDTLAPSSDYTTSTPSEIGTFRFGDQLHREPTTGL